MFWPDISSRQRILGLRWEVMCMRSGWNRATASFNQHNKSSQPCNWTVVLSCAENGGAIILIQYIAVFFSILDARLHSWEDSAALRKLNSGHIDHWQILANYEQSSWHVGHLPSYFYCTAFLPQVFFRVTSSFHHGILLTLEARHHQGHHCPNHHRHLLLWELPNVASVRPFVVDLLLLRRVPPLLHTHTVVPLYTPLQTNIASLKEMIGRCDFLSKRPIFRGDMLVLDIERYLRVLSKRINRAPVWIIDLDLNQDSFVRCNTTGNMKMSAYDLIISEWCSLWDISDGPHKTTI